MWLVLGNLQVLIAQITYKMCVLDTKKMLHGEGKHYKRSVKVEAQTRKITDGDELRRMMQKLLATWGGLQRSTSYIRQRKEQVLAESFERSSLQEDES